MTLLFEASTPTGRYVSNSGSAGFITKFLTSSPFAFFETVKKEIVFTLLLFSFTFTSFTHSFLFIVVITTKKPGPQ
jgi:hypothetical protein